MNDVDESSIGDRLLSWRIEVPPNSTLFSANPLFLRSALKVDRFIPSSTFSSTDTLDANFIHEVLEFK